MTSKLAVGISFSSPFINGNTKYIEMKFEAFESQKAIVLEIVKKWKCHFWPHCWKTRVTAHILFTIVK